MFQIVLLKEHHLKDAGQITLQIQKLSNEKKETKMIQNSNLDKNIYL